MAITKKTIDVSAYQEYVDWEQVKADGVEYVILRCGTGYPQNHADARFVQNVTACNKLKIPVGVYWFSYATNAGEAKAEANFVLNLIRKYRIDLPVVYDFEYDSVKKANAKGIKITKQLASEMARAFLSTIQNAKYYAMIYSNGDYLNNYFDSDITKEYDLWYAAWPNKTVDPTKDKPSRSCGIWQYGSSTVKGINGKVDTNVAYRDYVTIIKKAGLNNLPKDPIDPVNPPVVTTPTTPSVPSQQETQQVKLTNAKAYLRSVKADTILTDIASMLYTCTKRPVTNVGDSFDTSVNYIIQSNGTKFIIDLADYLKNFK